MWCVVPLQDYSTPPLAEEGGSGVPSVLEFVFSACLGKIAIPALVPRSRPWEMPRRRRAVLPRSCVACEHNQRYHGHAASAAWAPPITVKIVRPHLRLHLRMRRRPSRCASPSNHCEAYAVKIVAHAPQAQAVAAGVCAAAAKVGVGVGVSVGVCWIALTAAKLPPTHPPNPHRTRTHTTPQPHHNHNVGVCTRLWAAAAGTHTHTPNRLRDRVRG